MYFYLIIYVFLLFAALAEYKHWLSDVQRKYVYISIILSFILISALRWETGADWQQYHKYFTQVLCIEPYKYKFEIGFVWLAQLSKVLADNFNFFLFTLALLIQLGRGLFFYKYAQGYLMMALLLNFCLFQFDIFGFRQAVAISICLCAFYFAVEKKLVHFIFMVIWAMTFHISALIFLMVYPLYNTTLKRSVFITAIGIAIIFGAAQIIDPILKLLSQIPLGKLTERALAYSALGKDANYGFAGNKWILIVTGIIKRIFFLAFFLWIEKKYMSKNIFYKSILNIYLFGFIIYFLVIDFLPLQRLAGYFYPFEIILLCTILQVISNHKKKYYFSIFALYGLIKLLYILYFGYKEMVPYQWIL